MYGYKHAHTCTVPNFREPNVRLPNQHARIIVRSRQQAIVQASDKLAFKMKNKDTYMCMYNPACLVYDNEPICLRAFKCVSDSNNSGATTKNWLKRAHEAHREHDPGVHTTNRMYKIGEGLSEYQLDNRNLLAESCSHPNQVHARFSTLAFRTFWYGDTTEIWGRN